MAYNLRWGILATGGIAKAFVRDLLMDSSARGASDVTHTAVAVSSSSSKARAEQFIADLGIPAPCAAYGSYEELVKDPNVQAIYVATPHSHHFQNAMLCLENGKHVLCEKAFTVNAAQTKILVETAKKNGLFLMEAVWTRFFPLCVQIGELVKKGEIGEVIRVSADTSVGDSDAEKVWPDESRMVNMDLAGGVLLDLGIYSLTWVFQILYHTLPRAERKAPSQLSSQITKYPSTGADESTTMILEFPRSTPTGKYRSQGIAMTSLRVEMDPDGKTTAGPTIRIQGSEGEIQVLGYPFQPKRFKLIPRNVEGKAVREVREVVAEFPSGGRGHYWEADEVARCLRDGKVESETMPWEESIVIMDVMDEVRRQGDLKYPESIESTKYPLQI